MICRCREKLIRSNSTSCFLRTTSMIGTLDCQWPRLSERPSIFVPSMTRLASDSHLVVRPTQAAKILLLRLVRALKEVYRLTNSGKFNVKEGLIISDILKSQSPRPTKRRTREQDGTCALSSPFRTDGHGGYLNWEHLFYAIISVEAYIREMHKKAEATSANIG